MQKDRGVIDVNADEVSMAGRSERLVMSAGNKKVQKINVDIIKVNKNDFDNFSLLKEENSNRSIPNSEKMPEISSLDDVKEKH